MDKWIFSTIMIVMAGLVGLAGQSCYFNKACYALVKSHFIDNRFKENDSISHSRPEEETVVEEETATEPLPETQQTVVQEQPQTCPETKTIIVQQSDITLKNFKWTVPPGTRKVIIRLLTDKGRYINEYTISDFITITPNQKIQVISK